MKLISLQIRNFKGISDFRLDLGGKNATIKGDNATGKTSIYDAFLWLLFGKDSTGAADFTIEPAGSRGQGIETSVVASLITEKGVYTLERRRRENWVKERGATSATFRGFTTDYFCDSLPMKESAYKELIASFCPENLFKLITNPRALPAMKWQDQRATLFDICGDVPDDAIIAANPALAPLADRGRHSVEDFKKIQQARRRELNTELDMMPVRINEASMAIKADSETDIPAAQTKILELRKQLEGLEASMRPAGASEIAARIVRLRLDLDALEAENRKHITAQEDAARKTKADIIDSLRIDLRKAETELSDVLRKQTCLVNEDEQLKRKLFQLSEDYKQVSALTWTGDNCPSCGRPLPEEEVMPKRAAFNQSRADRLAAIDVDGKATAERRKEIDKQARELCEKQAQLQERVAELHRKISDAEAMTYTTTPLPDYEARREKITAELSRLEGDEEQRKAADEDRIVLLRGKAQIIRDEISKHETAILQTRANETQRKRIEELRVQQRAVAAELEDVDRRIALCEQFTRAKVAAVEESINSRFRIARWKLFEQQINGAVADCCMVTVGGVEYHDLNNAMQINVGLDIINTLSRHHGITAPIFVDNAEAVTRLEPVDAQTIRLVVSEAHKSLTVEVENYAGEGQGAA